MPAGSFRTGVTLTAYAGTDGTAFLGLQVGATFTEPASGTNVANLLGYTHFGTGPGNVGQNLLPAMGVAGGTIGFTPPLPGGRDRDRQAKQAGRLHGEKWKGGGRKRGAMATGFLNHKRALMGKKFLRGRVGAGCNRK